MSDEQYVVPRDVPAELTDDFNPARYPDIQPVEHNWATMEDKLDAMTLGQLKAIVWGNGGIGSPDTSPVSQVNDALDMDAL